MAAADEDQNRNRPGGCLGESEQELDNRKKTENAGKRNGQYSEQRTDPICLLIQFNTRNKALTRSSRGGSDVDAAHPVFKNIRGRC